MFVLNFIFLQCFKAEIQRSLLRLQKLFLPATKSLKRNIVHNNVFKCVMNSSYSCNWRLLQTGVAESVGKQTVAWNESRWFIPYKKNMPKLNLTDEERYWLYM